MPSGGSSSSERASDSPPLPSRSRRQSVFKRSASSALTKVCRNDCTYWVFSMQKCYHSNLNLSQHLLIRLLISKNPSFYQACLHEYYYRHPIFSFQVLIRYLVLTSLFLGATSAQGSTPFASCFARTSVRPTGSLTSARFHLHAKRPHCTSTIYPQNVAVVSIPQEIADPRYCRLLLR